MGIKISELTTANTLEGNELTPLVQSTETRQAAVSSVFTALTSQNDNRYVCGISSSDQGCLTFTGAGGGNIDLGLSECSSVIFSGLTACGDAKIIGDTTIDTTHIFRTNGPLKACCGVDIQGNLTLTNGNVDITGSTTTDRLSVAGDFCANGGDIATNCNILSGGCNLNTLFAPYGTGCYGDVYKCSSNTFFCCTTFCEDVSILGDNNLSVTGNILSAGCNLNVLFGGGDVCTTTENTFTCCTFFNEQTTMRDILSGTQIIVGATGNSITGDDSNSNSIIGGRDNIMEMSNAFQGCSVITGGNTNRIYCAQNNFIGGGSTNYICANANQNAIVGASGTIINGGAECSIVGGGQTNCIGANVERGAIIGGCCNCVTNADSVVAGGGNNCAFSAFAFIGGGSNNIAGTCSSVIGGCSNSAEGDDGAIIGGGSNCISCNHRYSVIAAGTSINSVSGCMLHVNRLYASDLPTSDPGVAGVVWNDLGTLKISV